MTSISLEDDEAYIPGVPGARSEVAVPLIADGMIIGVFNAESVEPNAFGGEHVQTLHGHRPPGRRGDPERSTASRKPVDWR